MRKTLLLSLFLVACGLTASAQQILKIGFEADEQRGVYTTKDSVQFAGFMADHINLQPGDEWNEASTDAHSGEYALELNNDNAVQGNTWHRGFKIRNINLDPGTSYRISYWIKADPTYETADGNRGNTSVKNTLSIGFENVEAPTVSPSGTEYYFNYTSGMTGDWRHIRNVTFFTDKATQDKYFDKYDDNTYVDEAGETIRWAEGMDGFAEQYFITINMYNPGTYVIDDIVLEKATIAGIDFCDYAIRVDFGYPTNIADLAKANNGSFSLDPATVTVKVNGQEVTPDYVEGKADGYLYIFFETTELQETDQVEVSFKGDSRLLYTTDRRPSTDVEGEVAVLPFEGEIADFNVGIEELPDAWSAPILVKTDPENDSFELDAATFKQVTFTYNKKIDISTASAVLESNGKQTDLSNGLSIAEDGCTLVVPVGNLVDGEYTITVSGVASAYGEMSTEDQFVTVQVGKDNDTSTSEVVYDSKFEQEMTGGIPAGWITYNEAGFHIYGFNDEARTSQYNYDWNGTPGGGGARLYAGFSGDFEKAMYWGTRGSNEGYCTYGDQVKDYIRPDGSFDPEMPENIALKLDARKYQISFLMAAWKGEPKFTFKLQDLEGNVYAEFNEITAAPNVNGTVGNVTGSKSCVKDFTVPAAGYYVLNFTSQEAQWQEFLLADVKLITMPSKAAYYRQMLDAAVVVAEEALETAGDSDYDGDTKTALVNEINRAKTETFTSPTLVKEEIKLLEQLAAALSTRAKNYDDYVISVIEAQEAADQYIGTKYENTAEFQTANTLLQQYADVEPKTLSDQELATVAPQLVAVAEQLKELKNCNDRLTWRLYKATQTAGMLADRDEEGNIIGGYNADVVNLGFEATTDDYALADCINESNMYRLYEILVANGGAIDDKYKTTLVNDQDETEVMAEGVEFTGLIKNPKFYTVYNNSDKFPGWVIEGNLGFNGATPTAQVPVQDVMANTYRGCYRLSQVVENVPVGIYDIELDCRTSAGMNGVNDETGIPDKYIWVSVAEGDTVRLAFAEGSWGTHTRVIKNVTVKDGQFSFGAAEMYTSGKNNTIDEGTGEEKVVDWDTNTFIDNARLFFVAPVDGYDYATAVETLRQDVELNAVSREVFTLSGLRLSQLQRGINIVRFRDAKGNTVTKKVLVK